MNRRELLKQLKELFSHFQYHEGFFSDLIDIIGKSGQEGKFLSVLMTQLKVLKEHGQQAILVNPKNFEHLKSTGDNLYSMHVNTSNFNVRIFYTFLEDGTVLLLPFNEKADSGKDSYRKHIPLAQKRKDEYVRRKKNEQKNYR